VEEVEVVLAGDSWVVAMSTLARYAARPGTSRTLASYDARANQWKDHLSRSDVVLTRSIRSRISDSEVDWFVERGRSAPWADLGPADTLVSARPGDPEGCLDRAVDLWQHFTQPPTPGIAWGKVSKVLHIMRPALVPIFDRQLRLRYRPRAREVALALGDSGVRYAWWESVRLDLVDPSTVVGLDRIRAWARKQAYEIARLADLTDVRLLDIVAWEGQRNPQVRPPAPNRGG
jgi:hypothetical protein